MINTLEKPQLDFLERLYNGCGIHNAENHAIVDIFIRRGILVDCGDNLEFSSPIMWRRFAQMRMGAFRRADDFPKTLEDLILRIIRSIDYKNIHETLGRSVGTRLPLERAWQMEFYKGSILCTPTTFETSVDVGAVFGSSGFLDFTIHDNNIL